MIINSTQLYKIGTAQEKKFIHMLTNEVKERFSLTGVAQSNLGSEIEDIVKECRTFEFIYDDDIEQFVYLKFLYPSFKKLPYENNLLEILQYPDRHPEIKINELINYFENYKHGE